MDKKLTLKMDRRILEKIKRYASERKLSLSPIVENCESSQVLVKESVKVEPRFKRRVRI